MNEIHIANAGMVLAAPLLPQLFKLLNLTSGQKFKDEEAAGRAVHLLQFMVDGSCASPELMLPLNKVLCGLSLTTPVDGGIELLAQEREAVERMLKTIIAHWSIIGDTSIQALRESFLQREGRLQARASEWRLKVVPKGMDVLLDRIPWSFSIIKHPWMTLPIYVEWR